MEERSQDITELLGRWSQGDEEALAELMPVVYGELRRLANRAIRSERADHTLEATALVHEAYLRLAAGAPPSLSGRVHFYSLAARLMRHVLVDHARRHQAARRGSGALRLALDEIGDLSVANHAVDLVQLDEALEQLSKIEPRKTRVIELRFFGGLTTEETAEILGVSVPTVLLDTRVARAWLFSRLFPGELARQRA